MNLTILMSGIIWSTLCFKRPTRPTILYIIAAGSILSDLSGEPLSLDTLQLLLVRESAQDPPQYFIQQWHGRGAEQTERCLSHFPHPFPTLKDLDKEILRSVLRAARLRYASRAPCGCSLWSRGCITCLSWPSRACSCLSDCAHSSSVAERSTWMGLR